MLFSFLSIPGLIILSYLSGCHLTAYLDKKSPGLVVCQSLLTGFSVLVIILSLLSAFLPIDAYAMPLLAGLFLLVFIHRRAIRHAWSTLREFIDSNEAPSLLIALVLSLIVLNLLPIILGENVMYEGGDNYDTLHWVVTAEQLQYHDYFEDVSPPEGQEVNAIFNQFTGWYTWDGRIGGELVLSFMSSIMGIEPMFLYNILVSSFLVFWVAVIRLFLGDLQRSFARWMLPFLVFGQPVFVFIIGNGNYPNLLGSILFGYLVFLVWDHMFAKPTLPWVLSMGVVANALFACYPELLPFGFFTVICLVLAEFLRGSSREVLLKYGLAGVAMFLFNPVSIVRGLGTIHLKGTASLQEMPRLFTFLEGHEFLSGLCTMAFPIVTDLNMATGLIFSVVFGVLLLWPLSLKDYRKLWAATGIGLLLLWAYSYHRDFPYGYQKAVINNGVLICSICWIGIRGLYVPGLDYPRMVNSSRRLLSCVSAILFVGFFVISYARVYSIGTNRSIALERDGLKEIRTIADGRTIIIDDRAFKQRKYFENWLPYVFRDQPTYFASAAGSALFRHEPVSNNDYVRWFGRMLPESEFNGENILLTASPLKSGLLHWEEEPVFTAGKFALYDFPGLFEYSGIYTWEGAFAWADASVRLYPTETCSVEIVIGEIFSSLPDGSRLRTRNHYTGETKTYDLVPGLKLRFHIRGGSGGYLELTSLAGAVRPSDVSDSTDDRPLAYQIRSIAIDPLRFLDGLVSVQGLHDWEGSHAWMGAEATLYSDQEYKARWLNVSVVDRFFCLPEGELLLNGSVIKLGTDSTFSIQVNPGETIRLVSTAGAMAPISCVEGSSDPRQLSYSFGHLSMTDEPLFPVLWQGQ